MSAQANLVGLYKPQGFQRWKRDLLWQPIPVHTQPVDTDYLIAGSVPTSCSSYQTAYANYLQSTEFLSVQAKAQPYYDLISVKMGVPVNSLMDLTLIRDAWLCESVHELR